MAISVFHNPSDNKLSRFLQVPAGLLPQGFRLRLRGGCNPGGPLRSLGLRLLQQSAPAVGGLSSYTLQERKPLPFRFGDNLLRLCFRGDLALQMFCLYGNDLLDNAYQYHPSFNNCAIKLYVKNNGKSMEAIPIFSC